MTEKAESILDRSTTSRLPSRALRWARRRFGADTFDEFLQSMLLVVGGEIDALDDDSQIADIERGLGLDRGRTDILPSGEPWLTGTPREDFH